MRKRWSFILILLMLVIATGCDSGSDDENGLTDAEAFVGTWRVSNLLLNGQDFSALLLASTQVDVVFDTNGNFDLTVTADGEPTEISGTYSVNESQQTVTLTSSAFEAPVAVMYDVQNDNRIVLETDDVGLFIGLTGIDPADLGIPVESITLIVSRVS